MVERTGVILRDTYEQAEAPDPVLSDAFVLGVARRHAPGARSVDAVDETGGEARTYMVDAEEGPLVVKTQRPHRRRARTSLEKEALFLRHLTTLPGEPLPIPRVLGHGRTTTSMGSPASAQVDAEIEYTVMTRIPGDALQRVSVEGKERQAVLRELGAALRRIHQAPQEPLLASSLFPGDRAPGDLALRLKAPAMEAARRLSGSATAALLSEAPEALVSRVVATLSSESPRVALHSNPSAVHTFVNPSTGKFTGLIDFGDAYVSHPALDLRRWDRHEDREALLKGYRQQGDLHADFLRVWRVGCILAEIAALAARSTSTPEDANQRVSVIRALLDQLT